MSEPGLEVMATVEMVGVVAWAWATDTESAKRARIATRTSSRVKARIPFIVDCYGAQMAQAAPRFR